MNNKIVDSEENIDDPSKRKKVNEIENGKDQKPKDTILINNFVRPLVTRSVKELVGKYGDVKNFWMDSIKTHAFVTVCLYVYIFIIYLLKNLFS